MAATFLYTALPQVGPSDWNNSYDLYKNGRLLLESQIYEANVNVAERKDLADGRRVYRIHPKDSLKIPTDSQGPFLYDPRTSNGRFRFTTTDPSGPTLITRDWVNIRS